MTEDWFEAIKKQVDECFAPPPIQVEEWAVPSNCLYGVWNRHSVQEQRDQIKTYLLEAYWPVDRWKGDILSLFKSTGTQFNPVLVEEAVDVLKQERLTNVAFINLMFFVTRFAPDALVEILPQLSRILNSIPDGAQWASLTRSTLSAYAGHAGIERVRSIIEHLLDNVTNASVRSTLKNWSSHPERLAEPHSPSIVAGGDVRLTDVRALYQKSNRRRKI